MTHQQDTPAAKRTMPSPSSAICRLGVLISGRGSNMASVQAAIEAGALCDTEIAVVISDKTAAPGLSLAQRHGLATAVVLKKDPHTGEVKSQADLDQAIRDCLTHHQVDLVVLAGYGRVLSSVLLDAFPNRIVNIHPSLLPAYGGKGMVGIKVHEAVVRAGEKRSGCTVHMVTEEVDGGPILGWAEVPVLPEDTPELLAARVLQEEHRLYPQVLQRLIHNTILPEKSSVILKT